MPNTDVTSLMLQVPFRILRYHSLWPSTNQTSSSLLFKLRVVVMMLFFSITGAGGTLHFLRILLLNDPYFFIDILEDLVVMSVTAFIYFTLLCFVRRLARIQALIEAMSDFGEFGPPPTFKAMNRRANLIVIGSYAYAYGGVVAYVFFALLHAGRCREESAAAGIPRLCGFMTPMWLPFDAGNAPVYQMVWLAQVSSCTMICSSALLVLAFFYGIIELFLTRVAHMKGMMREVAKLKSPVMRRALLVKCIRYHHSILNLADQINDTLGTILFAMAFFITIMLSMLGVQFLVEPSMKTFVHAIGWVQQMFMQCYSGQRLIDETSDIPMEIYSIDWYEDSLEMQKDILFIIMRSNKPMFLDAAGFFEISIPLFGFVMKNAYSFLALLHQTLNPPE